MDNIYIVKSKYNPVVYFVKGENKNNVAEKFLHHEFIGVDTFSKEEKEKYKQQILKNFEIVSIDNFDNNDICKISIEANNAHEGSNEIEITIDIKK